MTLSTIITMAAVGVALLFSAIWTAVTIAAFSRAFRYVNDDKKFKANATVFFDGLGIVFLSLAVAAITAHIGGL